MARVGDKVVEVGKIIDKGDDALDIINRVDEVKDAITHADDAEGLIRAIPIDQVGTSQPFKTFKNEDGLSVFERVSPKQVLDELPGNRVPNTTVTIPKNKLPAGTTVITSPAPGLSKSLSDAHRIIVRPEGMSVDRFAKKIKEIVGW